MKSWNVPIWLGAAVGVAAAGLLTWVLRTGSQSFLSAVRMADPEGLAVSGWALFVSGLVVAVVLWAAVLHPLIPGIPAAWFLIRFAPTLLGAAGSPAWYPTWIGRHILVDLYAGSFILTGLLVAATVYSLWRRKDVAGSDNEEGPTQPDQSLIDT